VRAADTNLLVRILTRDDPQQAAAADRFIQAGAWVSILALVEAIWVLGRIYAFDPGQLADAVELILQHEHLTIQDVDLVSSALNSFRAHPAVGFSDCLILETARKHGYLPLGTFDRRLGKLDGAHKL
jgi:predicted nucleic-acid-binding protein